MPRRVVVVMGVLLHDVRLSGTLATKEEGFIEEKCLHRI